MDIETKAIVSGIVLICTIVGGVVSYNTLYYNFTPQIIFQTQSSSTNNTPNSCTIQAYSSVCPFTLTSGQPAFFYLENLGDVPAYFSINFTSSNSMKLSYYSKSSTVKGGQTTYFGFVPTFSNKTNSFTIGANATCTPQGWLSFCKGSSQILVACNYKITNNSQIATLVPTPVN